MIGDFNRARLAVGRLRAFASLTTCSHPGADAIVLDLLKHRGDSTPVDAVALYRDLYRRLRQLPPRLGATRPASAHASPEIWSDFQQLRDVQRGAVFLVLGLDFSIEEAATVLDEAESRLTMEVISAMFSLEHILPGERAHRQRRPPERPRPPRRGAPSGGASARPPSPSARQVTATPSIL